MPLIQYLYKLLIAFLLVVSFGNGAAQLFLLIAVTIGNVIYYFVVKPYVHYHKHYYNNYLVIHNLICFVLICLILAVMIVQQN